MSILPMDFSGTLEAFASPIPIKVFDRELSYVDGEAVWSPAVERPKKLYAVVLALKVQELEFYCQGNSATGGIALLTPEVLYFSDVGADSWSIAPVDPEPEDPEPEDPEPEDPDNEGEIVGDEGSKRKKVVDTSSASVLEEPTEPSDPTDPEEPVDPEPTDPDPEEPKEEQLEPVVNKQSWVVYQGRRFRVVGSGFTGGWRNLVGNANFQVYHALRDIE